MGDALAANDERDAERRLAVYGSLAPGRANAWVLAPLAGRWYDGVVRGRRIAAGWGNALGYPGVRPDPGGDEIAVQVFESDELPAHWERLDAFEGAEYERVTVPVHVGGEIVFSQVYVIRV